MKVHQLLFAAAVLLVCWSWSAPAASNPLDAYGFGAIGVARQGAVVATVQDISANYYNPAGLAASSDLRLEFGYTYVQPRLTMNGRDQDVDRTYGAFGGLALPGSLWGRRVAVSVGTFLPAERISRIRALPQLQPRWALYDNEPQRLVITTSGAVEFSPWLRFGFGLTYLSNTVGTLDLGGVVDLLDEDQTALFSGVNVDLSSVRYLSAGLQGDLGGGWSYGLAFRDEFSLDLDLVVDVQGDIVRTTGGSRRTLVQNGRLLFDSSNTNLFSPRQLALGVAWEGGVGGLELNLTWRQWSRMPPPTSTIEIELDLGGALDFSIPPMDRPLPTGFRDIVLFHLGGFWRAVDEPRFGADLRFGYRFEPSPAPDQPTATNYIDAAEHGLGLGLGLRFEDMTALLPKPVFLDVAWSMTRMVERTFAKEDPADPVGDIRTGGFQWGIVAHVRLHL